MSEQGYYRFPDVRDDIVIFVSEDDLWQVPTDGGIARRLTANLGDVMSPKISPDKKWVAYAATEEGHREIYVMDVDGSTQKRITFLGTICTPLIWSKDSQYVYFVSDFEQAYDTSIYRVHVHGGEPIIVPVGYATQISFDSEESCPRAGGCVIGRHTRDTARWKRYRGGKAGEFWIDVENRGVFRKLTRFDSNVTDPMWIGNRIYFISDCEGIGNVYSCDLDGQDVQRHTHHEQFYVRNASTDDKTIVYHSGGDLYALDVARNEVYKIEVDYHSSHTQTNRRFINTVNYLQGYDLSPRGTHTVVAIRGKIASFAHWTGPITQWGKQDGVRYRMPTYLQDNKHMVASTDEVEGEDRLLLVDVENGKQETLNQLDMGRIHGIFPSPTTNQIVVTNHKHEMWLVDCDEKTLKILDKNDYCRIQKVSWSQDGNWITYDFATTLETIVIKVLKIKSGKSWTITSAVKADFCPVFSNDGKYIFFIGDRIFYPIYDSLHFELSFLKSSKLYAIPLRKDVKSPFIHDPQSPAGDENADTKKDKKGDKEKPKKLSIDFENIEKRLIQFPIAAGMYHSLQTFGSKVFYLEYPRDGLKKDENGWFSIPKPRNILKMYDLEKLTEEVILEDITNYKLSLKGSNTIVRTGGELAVYKTGEKPKDKVKNKYSLESGKIDMNRIRIGIHPQEEWKQMYRETWLLQREHFWVENMSGVDWPLVYKRYCPLLDRVGSRGEFSDLIWEMQGELGTSHCYELGGDYRGHPYYLQAKLGCSYELAKNGKYYIFREIFYGDSANPNEISPLLAPAVNIAPGDHLIAINGTPVNRHSSPRELLVNLGGQEVTLTVQKKGEKKTKHIAVDTLETDKLLLYRAWVENNRNYVHTKSKGKLGYIHIPDMGVRGFAEFHRYYLVEYQYEGLVVDTRYNSGGHVSQLLLEKLNRKRIAYNKARWSKEAGAYPDYSVGGPMIAITNEFAGSDGDVFCHAFKLMKLGKLIGKRTWGGVIGITGQYSLVDGSITTQPEYSIWFNDVGWGVENYGTEPDIEVEITPQDYVASRDSQLDRAVDILLEDLEKNPVVKPKLADIPDLSLPKLPKR